MSCPFCGEAFIRRWNRSVTCGKVDCDRARQRKNKQNSRKKQKIAAKQNNRQSSSVPVKKEQRMIVMLYTE